MFDGGKASVLRGFNRSHRRARRSVVCALALIAALLGSVAAGQEGDFDSVTPDSLSDSAGSGSSPLPGSAGQGAKGPGPSCARLVSPGLAPGTRNPGKAEQVAVPRTDGSVPVLTPRSGDGDLRPKVDGPGGKGRGVGKSGH